MFRLFFLLLVVVGGQALSEVIPFTLLHTNDLHSQVEGSGPDRYFTPKANDGDPVRGHFARLAHLIKKIKKEKQLQQEGVLTVDAGDFFSGSLFHILDVLPSSAYIPGFEFFVYTGYDAVNLGNHEFDGGEKAIANMFTKARSKKLKLDIVATNLSMRGNTLKPYLVNENVKGIGIKKTVIKEIISKGKKLRIGILGLLGPDAALVSAGNRRESGFSGFDDDKSKENFSELVKTAAKYLKVLRKKHKVDVTVILFHGGDPEDEKLAKNLEDVDIIISGHSHESYHKVVKGTIIAQAGSFGHELGILELAFEKGKVKLKNDKSARRVAINDSITADPVFLKTVDRYKKAIGKLLAPLAYQYEAPVYTVTKDMIHERDPHNPLGIMVCTGILNELNKKLAKPVDIYFTSMGLIRSQMVSINGKPTIYQFSDVFRMLPIGFDKAMFPGSPIVTFYMTPKEVDQLVNFTDIYGHISKSFTSVYSEGLSYRIRSWGIPFINRISDLKLFGKEYKEWKGLIRVGTSLYVARNFKKLPQLSYGLLNFYPRDSQGKKLDRIEPQKGFFREYALFSDYLRENK